VVLVGGGDEDLEAVEGRGLAVAEPPDALARIGGGAVGLAVVELGPLVVGCGQQRAAIRRRQQIDAARRGRRRSRRRRLVELAEKAELVAGDITAAPVRPQ